MKQFKYAKVVDNYASKKKSGDKERGHIRIAEQVRVIGLDTSVVCYTVLFIFRDNPQSISL